MNEQHKNNGLEKKQDCIEDISKSENLEMLDIRSNTAGIIAHDINNHLVAIFGNISLAKIFIGENNEALDKLALAEKACKGLNEYSNRLVAFARASLPVLKEESIGKLVKNSALVALQDGQIKRKFDIDEDLYPVAVDQVLIKEVLSSIVTNAADALRGKGMIKIQGENVTIDADSDLPLKEGKYVRITIRDDGPGIPPEKLEGIFIPSFKATSGFGLPLSQYVMKKHHGHITLESEQGRGTTCRIYLPAAPDNAGK